MAGYNIRIDLLKIAGAKEMEIQGKRARRKCVVIPIDNEAGVVCDGTPSGWQTMRSFSTVYLNLTANEARTVSYGQTHIVKESYNKDFYGRLTEEQRRALPIVGHLKPFGSQAAQQAPAPGVEDLPPDSVDLSDEW